MTGIGMTLYSEDAGMEAWDSLMKKEKKEKMEGAGRKKLYPYHNFNKGWSRFNWDQLDMLDWRA